MSEPQTQAQPPDPRVSREEEYWNAPRLFLAGFAFLGVCITVIYLMATFAFSAVSG